MRHTLVEVELDVEIDYAVGAAMIIMIIAAL